MHLGTEQKWVAVILHWLKTNGGRRKAIAIVASGIALTVFFTVADQVREQSHHTTHLDRTVSLWMHAHEFHWVTRAALLLAALGSPTMMTCIGTVSVICAFIWRRLRAGAISIPVSIIGAGCVIQIVKLICHRARPSFFIPLLKTSGYSFPSGHAVIAMTLYGMLGYLVLLRVRTRSLRMAITTATITLILAIGASRIYVGVHYTTDVIAGWSIAVPWLMACISLHDWIARRIPEADKPLIDELDDDTSGATDATPSGSDAEARRTSVRLGIERK